MARTKSIPTGKAVDPSGGPVVDPTANVISLTEAATKRQDDLREQAAVYDEQLRGYSEKLQELRVECQVEIGDLRDRHRNEIGAIREAHQGQLRVAESQRLDAIRQVDREDVNKTAAQVLSAVTTLAQQNSTTAETLRTQVATTAAAASVTFNAYQADTNKRLASLEQSSFEGKGKQTLADPQMAALLTEMQSLRESRTLNTGSSTGMRDMWGWIVAAIVAGAAIMNFAK